MPVVAWGIKGLHLFLGTLVLGVTLVSARSLTISRNPWSLGMFAYCVVLTVGIAASWGWLPQRLAQLPMLLGTVLFLIFLIKYRPVRMDYSLYLRAIEGMLQPPANPHPTPSASHLDRGDMLAFARFLGSRWLVNNFRWEAEGMALRLPPVKTSFLVNMASVFMLPMTQGFSRLLLKRDGTVAVRCGRPG